MIGVVTTDAMYPALLRYWRGSRGMSQLDLAGAAEVSAKHISFLETGRARPSREMVLRLATALGVPLREQNAMLVAAGFAEMFREPDHGLLSIEDRARLAHEALDRLVRPTAHALLRAVRSTARPRPSAPAIT
jgi:transcriptional regulator with XRE-family HTH domain